MFFSRRSSGNAHWSKDYIEHLRTIHFVLVILAVSAIVLSKTPNVAKLRVAQHQTHNIRDFVDKQVSEIKHRFDQNNELAVINWWIEFTYQGKHYAAKRLLQYLVITPCTPDGKIDDPKSFDEWQAEFVEVETLSNFATIWNRLHCGNVTRLEVNGGISSMFIENIGLADVRGIPLKEVEATGTDLLQQGFQMAYLEPSFQGDISDIKDVNEIGLKNLQFIGPVIQKIGDPTKPTLHFLETAGISASDELLLPIYAREYEVKQSGHEEIIQSNQPEWSCAKTFAECFPELNEVAQGRADYKLKELSDFLDNQIAHYDQDMQVFGMRFPAEQQSLWGIILLLSILSYFWLHLRELAPQLSADHPGTEVAWIGLYVHWYAYTLVWASILFVPLISVLLLGFQGLHFERFSIANIAMHWVAFALWVVLPGGILCVLGLLSCIRVNRLAQLAGSARNQGGTSEPKDSAAAHNA
jgi:hypothetical protein